MKVVKEVIWLGVTVSIGCLTGGRPALAQGWMAPESSAVVEGNYSVTWVSACEVLSPPYSCAFTYLQERAWPKGDWTNVSSGSGSVTISSKRAGTYRYRVFVGVFDQAGNYFTDYSPEITVVVPASPRREHILAQLEYDYAVKQGDINGDGRTDLFISKTAGGDAYNGTVEEIILRQSSGGAGFSAVVPTSADVSFASSWPDAPVDVILEDINVDGYADVFLSGVANVIDGADDQIVYAPGRPYGSVPKGVRAFDWEMARFVGNTMDYFAYQDYFSDFAPTYYYEASWWFVWCQYPVTPPLEYYSDYYYYYDWAYPVCYVDYYFLAGTYQDFSMFSDEALSFWVNDYNASQGYVDEEEALSEVETDVEDLIGSPIGGWPMEEILGPVGEHTDPFNRRGIELGQSVLAQARGGSDRLSSRLMPPQISRVPDHIYITGHPLSFARTRGHLALEFIDSTGGVSPYPPETLSAAPERNNILDMGKLIANRNRPTDDPFLNFYVGDVDPKRQTESQYWQTWLRARHNHYVDLPYADKVRYALLPGSGSGAHNSNGYISGITRDTPDNVEINVPSGIGWMYPGWNVPVPDYKFR